MKSRKEYYQLEKIFKGAANHRRLEVLSLLKQHKMLSTEELVNKLNVNYQTASEHLRKLVSSGLATSHREGVMVLYTLSPYGELIINLLKKP